MIQTRPPPPITRRTVLAGAALGGRRRVHRRLHRRHATRRQRQRRAGRGAVGRPAAGRAAPRRPRPTPQPSPTGPLKFANWPAYIDLAGTRARRRYRRLSPTLDGLPDPVRDRGQLPGEDRRQRGLLRDDRAGARRGPRHGLGPDRPDRLDGRPSSSPRLGREDRPAPTCPTASRTSRDELKGSRGTPNMEYHFPWQSGMTGVGYNVEDAHRQRDRGADEDRATCAIPRRQGHVPVRGARTRSASAAARARATITNLPQTSPTRTSRRSRTTSSRSSTAGTRGSPATSTCRTSRRRRSGRRSSGPATSRRRAGEDDRFIVPDRGRADLDRQHADPEGRGQHVRGRADDGLRVRRQGRGADRRVRSTTSRRSRARPRTIAALDDPSRGRTRSCSPRGDVAAKQHSFQALSEEQEVTFNELFASSPASSRVDRDPPMTAAAPPASAAGAAASARGSAGPSRGCCSRPACCGCSCSTCCPTSRCSCTRSRRDRSRRGSR